jgi:hypothetical protein
MALITQETLFSGLAQAQQSHDASSSTFLNNMSLPVHRWIRYSAGFSGAWARQVIQSAAAIGEVRVFDPFAGSGTTLIAAEDAGAESIGIEAHPFVHRLARAKLARRSDLRAYHRFAKGIESGARRRKAEIDGYPKLIRACYTDDALADLDRLRRAFEAADDDSNAARLAWLTLVGILRACSRAATAQWQYVLPRKSKKAPARPYEAFQSLRETIETDMADCVDLKAPSAKLIRGDARDCNAIPDRFANLVVTSPPYPNNYEYADATRLEMCFFGEIRGWGDLQFAVRRHLIRSCTQHVPERAVDLNAVLADPNLASIGPELEPICERLAEARLGKGGKKTYHLMVATYFQDLAGVWRSMRRACDSPSEVCFVIGDSAPYGVYVPAIDWLGRLAVDAGFKSFRFERTRDRNVKWRNRKHRVPLCEGRLWVKG